jgi:ubiquinol-cytochrome c reductase iron-sulfur subunit
MSDSMKASIGKSRRRFLVAGTTVIGVAGIAAAAWPFLNYMEPSARALASGAPIEVDISKLEPGQLITVQFRGRPIWVLRRTAQQLKELPTLNSELRDPLSKVQQQLPSCQNIPRSLKPEYFVAVALCTHLGCVPTYRPAIAPADLGPDWKGGFFCPCHGSRYDLAGRVYKDVPAPNNLPVPPYFYVKDTVIRVGETEDGGHKNWRPVVW